MCSVTSSKLRHTSCRDHHPVNSFEMTQHHWIAPSYNLFRLSGLHFIQVETEQGSGFSLSGNGSSGVDALYIVERGCLPPELICNFKKETNTPGGVVLGNIQLGIDIFGHSRRPNYAHVTAMLGVTLSNFYPLVFVHTSWLSYQYVCILYRSEWKGECVWRGGISLGVRSVYMLLQGVCVCVCWACVGLLDQIKAAGSACWLSHLLQHSCKLLKVPGWL